MRKILAGFGQHDRSDFKSAFPPHTPAGDDTGVLQDRQVLSDPLPGKACALCELRNGLRFPIAEAG